MSLVLPDIPVAARSLADIEKSGEIADLIGYDRSDAIASRESGQPDEIIIWSRPTLRGYKAVWRAAINMGIIKDDAKIDRPGSTFDIDHVFPRSWARLPIFEVSYVRLFPVWREVNRGAGGGRERFDPYASGFKPNRMKNGIYFASDLQLRKMLGHEVGSTKDRTAVFNS